MLHKRQFDFLHDQQEEEEEEVADSPENVADSPSSNDIDETNVQLIKNRRGTHKKVVTVTIGGGDDPRSKAEIHPPKDSWSWRKYGQKPIKGSQYPRGYYKCSSSKGCPAKKQVERSCHDPNILLVTYSGEHNHHSQSTTTTKLNHIHHLSALTATSVSPNPKTSNTTSSMSNVSDTPSTFSQEEIIVAPDISNLSELAGEMGWLSYMGSTLLDNTDLVCPSWAADVDVTVLLPIGEEDQSLFGDLGELPESSFIFRQGIMDQLR